jgi:ATP-dependent RNA helicase DDX56/DBP9
VLVPTRELSEQVTSFLRSVLKYCENVVSVVNVAVGTANNFQK